jgi:hypothetical protein
MKTFAFTIFTVTLLTADLCLAQSFIDTTKIWSIVITDSGGGPSHGSKTTSYFKFTGDTTINSKDYFVLCECNDVNRKIWRINSYWREKNDSVFQFNPNTGNEDLIYDFILTENDSFLVDEQITLYVDSVRMKEWGEKVRKHWYFHKFNGNTSNITVWIEGVGNINNFTQSSDIDIAGAFTNLLCFTENGELVYQNPEYNSCYINTKTYNLPPDMLWTIMSGPSCGYDESDCRSYYTKISGDTTINEIQYKMVLNSTDSMLNDWSVAGFIREVGQKVFYRQKNVETDCLLYDFGCSEGDTLNLNCWCTDSKTHFKVDSIRYVQVMGENRKHIYLSYLNNSSNEIWIEGIGSLSGLLNGGGRGNCMTGFHEGLLCCSKNGEKIYQYSKFADCNIGSLINNSKYNNLNQLLSLYPNPANNKITISNPSNIPIKKIELIDFSGRVIQLWEASQLFENTLNIQHIPPGIYLLKAKTESGIKTGKLVVQ